MGSSFWNESHAEDFLQDPKQKLSTLPTSQPHISVPEYLISNGGDATSDQQEITQVLKKVAAFHVHLTTTMFYTLT